METEIEESVTEEAGGVGGDAWYEARLGRGGGEGLQFDAGQVLEVWLASVSTYEKEPQ